MKKRASEWVGRNCRFAMGGIADQIADSLLATNKSPTPQQVQQAIQMFMQNSAVQLPPEVNIRTLSQQIMNVINGRGGNPAPASMPAAPQPPRQPQPKRQNPFAF